MATVNTSTGTYLSNLFNPQVVGDMLNVKLTDAIKLAPLAIVDTTLEGRPGDTVTLPYYGYIGDAQLVAEGTDISISQLTEQTKSVKIKKFGKGVQLTDEAVLSGYGDPIGQATYQLALSIASAVDNDLLAALDANTVVHEITTAMTPDDIADALTLFGEDLDGEKVLLTNADGYATLRKSNKWIPNTELGADIIIRGTVGMIHGCQVVVTNRIKEKTNVTNYHIVKPGALALYMKRDTLVEVDRDIINKSTVMTADKHFATYLLDASKAVRIEQTVAGE